MSLTPNQKNSIEDTIKKAILNKLQNYKPETEAMPFHYCLLGRDRMSLYRFIHSLNTTFGTSIFEPVACIVAQPYFQEVTLKKNMGKYLSSVASNKIGEIMDSLTAAEIEPNHASEFQKIKEASKEGKGRKVAIRNADIFLHESNASVIAIDIKTAKPNIDSFEKYKRSLLQWIACALYKDSNIAIRTIIAIPYNPYEPKPYGRWTLRGMLDLEKQLLVGDKFWDFLAGGEPVYEDLLECFERAGQSIKRDIDDRFSQFPSGSD